MLAILYVVEVFNHFIEVSLLFVYNKLLYKMGQGFVDIQYVGLHIRVEMTRIRNDPREKKPVPDPTVKKTESRSLDPDIRMFRRSELPELLNNRARIYRNSGNIYILGVLLYSQYSTSSYLYLG